MNLSWYSLARQEFLDIVLGECGPQGAGMNAPDVSVSDVALGVSDAGRDGTPFVAAALVGPRKNELFSWILTYAEEAFPLTQFCRICSVDDWDQLGLDVCGDLVVGAVDPIWPSVVLGEMIGLADGIPDVAGAPLVRATACYSFAIARTTLLYPSRKNALNICMNRLAVVEHESRFARRNITVGSLQSAWSVAEAMQDIHRESIEIFDPMLKVVGAIAPSMANLLIGDKFLLSDSAEDRVAGFDSVVNKLLGEQKTDKYQREPNVVAIAAAALLAGRGTSHIQLLTPVAKHFPEVFVWFGLLAGVVGPHGWDKAWMQQVKGVERSLRQFFRRDEPVTADLCWAEYEWLSKTYKSPEVLNAFPKSAPRSLAIELLPGVNCQFRFEGQASNEKANEDRRLAELMAINKMSSMSESVILQAVDMLANVQHLLKSKITAEKSKQQSLFENEPTAKQGRGARKKAINKPEKKSTR